MSGKTSIRYNKEFDVGSVERVGLFSSFYHFPAPLIKNLSAGTVRVRSYTEQGSELEHYAFIIGQPKTNCVVRVHSECLTGDVFESRKCDCGDQLAQALALMLDLGAGVVVYLRQEGRGIGLGNKLRAYELQQQGLDTIDANLALGFPADLRDYSVGAAILTSLGLGTVKLLTNNPDKRKALEDAGIQASEQLGIRAQLDPCNERYLSTKRTRLGHSFPDWSSSVASFEKDTQKSPAAVLDERNSPLSK